MPEGKDGKLYYFPDDITDKAVEWLHAVRAQDASKPWFLYYSTGCTHAPHHVAKEWADKYKGQFDDGWDNYREQTLARQKKLGIVPPDTELTERPDLFPRGTRSATRRRSSTPARWRSTPASRRTPTGTSAGCSTSIEEMGDLDNTLIFYIWGDNGASMEGTLTGSFNEMTFLNGVVLDADAAAGAHREVRRHRGARRRSTPRRTSRRPGRTPATRRSSGASRWPATSAARATRWSWRGRTGSSPTRLAHASSRTASTSARPSSKLPASPSRRWSTASSRSRWTARASSTPSTTPTPHERHTVQYFEMYGSRAIYKDGWWACAKTGQAPVGLLAGDARTIRARRIYDPEQRPVGALLPARRLSAGHDLAAEHPDKLAELQELWWQEAERNRVLPLLGGLSRLLRHPAAAADDHPVQLRRRRPERSARHDPAHLRALVRDRGRAARAGRRRRGRDRRQRRLHRRVRACGSTTRGCSTTPTRS